MPHSRPSWPRLALAALLPAAALWISPVVAAGPADEEPPETVRPAIGPRAGGRIAGVDSDRLDLLGDVWADVPLASPGPGDLFTSWFARSAIADTTSDFAFTVRDLEYRLDLGWRYSLRGGTAVSFALGQRGRTEVDARGEAWVRYAGFGVASRDLGRSGSRESPAERLSWGLVAGPVLEESGVHADALVHGAARARLLGERLALDLELDGLIDGGHDDVDVTVGPSLGLVAAEGRRMALFVRYLDAGNPLGIRDDAWLAGFEYEEGPPGYVRAGRPSGADIGGVLALGAGEDDRRSAQLRLGFLTPPLGAELRIAFSLDANVLTGDETDELYYLYDVGLERVLRNRPRTGQPRAIVGAYFYHRSNHQLDRAGVVTSINVAELAVKTPGWDVAAARERGRLGAVDARIGAGYLLDSDFGLDHRWHARAGLRWRVPLGSRVVPFLHAEAEFGDADRRLVAAGALVGPYEFRLEHRSDDQYFSADDAATLVTAGYAF